MLEIYIVPLAFCEEKKTNQPPPPAPHLKSPCLPNIKSQFRRDLTERRWGEKKALSIHVNQKAGEALCRLFQNYSKMLKKHNFDA